MPVLTPVRLHVHTLVHFTVNARARIFTYTPVVKHGYAVNCEEFHAFVVAS